MRKHDRISRLGPGNPQRSCNPLLVAFTLGFIPLIWSHIQVVYCQPHPATHPLTSDLRPLTSFPYLPPDARKIMEGVYRQDTSRDSSWRAVMDVRDKKGVVRQKQFIFRKLGSLGDSKTLVRFTDPPEVRGVGLLSINRKGVSERQWMYTPAIQRIRRIAPQERSRKFLGTDFTNEDMAERVLDDFEYRLIGMSDLMDGRKTYKIEAKPVASDRTQYKFSYLWVVQDLPYVVHAEMYDARGRVARIYHAADLDRIAGIWIARRVEMTTPSEGTRTILKIDDVRFNLGLKPDQFTQQALEKAE
ncbi:MAG: outer membrane lipoprotein-sorting protein [Acidobacteria bacterium]|nr:outer membrane lipoprotein-sorting protein [Acidobacteriota bacterium]